jgi:hypothetical protein
VSHQPAGGGGGWRRACPHHAACAQPRRADDAIIGSVKANADVVVAVCRTAIFAAYNCKVSYRRQRVDKPADAEYAARVANLVAYAFLLPEFFDALHREEATKAAVEVEQVRRLGTTEGGGGGRAETGPHRRLSYLPSFFAWAVAP